MAQTPPILTWTSADGDAVATGTLSPDRSDVPRTSDVQPAFSSSRALNWNRTRRSLQRLLLHVHSSADPWRPRPRLSGCRVRTRLPRRASPLLASDFQRRTRDSSFRPSTSRPSSGYELASCPHRGVSGTREARGEGDGGTAVGGAVPRAAVGLPARGGSLRGPRDAGAIHDRSAQIPTKIRQ